MLLDKETIYYLKNHKEQINNELLNELRKTKEGKQIALDILETKKNEEEYYLDAFGNQISFNGNRQIKKAYTKIALMPIHLEEIEKCSKSIEYFRDNYVKIKTPNGINFPDLRKYQNEFISELATEQESYVVLYPRQSGKSVTTAIYLCWLFLFSKDINIGIAANRGSMAREFLNNVKNIFLALPIWLQQGIKTWNKGSILSENNVRILTDACSGDSYRGFTCNLIIVDEAAYISSTKWNDFVDGVLPSQSSLAWKKTIFLSTPNGMNHFYDIVQGAKKHKIIEDVNKEDIKNYDNIINIIKNKDDTYNIELNESSNNFKLITVDWREVPRYDSKGRRLDPEEFKRITIEKSGIVFFNQAYACEFIGSSYTLISSDTLKTFESKNPIDYLHVPNSDQVLKIYEEVIERHKYLIAIDGAKDGNDNFAIQILDITTLPFKQVGAGKLSIDYLLMPSFIDEIGTIYNNAFVIIENNEGAGQSIADMLYESYEYANLYFDKDLKNNYKKYPGFRTTTKTRDQILKTLKLMLENNQLLICDNDTIKEFFTFILKKNKFQADDGFHDDMVMSLAIAMCIFSNTNNFEDMKIIIDNIYSKENENIDITAMLTIGDFYDGSHEADNTNTDLNIYNFGI